MLSAYKMAARKKQQKAGDDEAAFLRAYDATRFQRLSVAVDVALLTVDQGRLRTLGLRRAEHPYRGRVVLPGGFVRPEESLDQAARRVLESKVGIQRLFIEQLCTFGEPDRDPRTRVISVAYYALIDAERFHAACTSRSELCLAHVRVPWAGETGGAVTLEDEQGGELGMGFDHDAILGTAVKRLRGKLNYAPIGFQLLPEEFTLADLQRVHEVILDHDLNKDSFRRRMLASGVLEATGRHVQGASHRPPELYRFRQRSAL
jgi:8-oxo-dGTP diphosphatase